MAVYQWVTCDLSKSLMASANPRIEKSCCSDGVSEFLCLMLFLSHPLWVLLVTNSVQGPPSVMKSQIVLTSDCPGGLIIKMPSVKGDHKTLDICTSNLRIEWKNQWSNEQTNQPINQRRIQRTNKRRSERGEKQTGQRANERRNQRTSKKNYVSLRLIKIDHDVTSS